MRNIFRSILFFLAFSSICISCNNSSNEFQAPTEIEKGWLMLNSKACFFDDSVHRKDKIILEKPDKKETQLMDAIMKFTGLPQNFSIYRSNISTAMATVVNNQRFIIYNKNLLANKNETDNAYWSSIFILAHEIGHHLANNISDTINLQHAELEADRFAGTVLYSMGADSNQVLTAITSGLISNEEDSKNHSSKDKRLSVVKESWFKAYRNRYESVVPPTVDEELVVKEFTEKNLVFNSKWNDYLFEDNSSKKALDTLNLLKEFGLCKNLKGIILEVQKIPNEPTDRFSKNLIQLKIIVKIIPNKSECKNDFPVNEKFEFDIDYESNYGISNKISLLDFFVSGRRIEFDIIFLSMCDGCTYNIARAKSL